MLAVTLSLVVLAAFGHAAFWVALDNRWHSLGYSRLVTKSVAMVFFACLLAPFVAAAWSVANDGWPSSGASIWQNKLVLGYACFCAVFAVLHLANWWTVRRLARQLPQAVTIEREQSIDLVERLGKSPARGPRARLLYLAPGNQLCHLHTSEAAIAIRDLPHELSGLSIMHWSDLHLSGRLDPDYYRAIVQVSNQQPADLLVLTGDVCDKAFCIDWIVDLFGPAQARLGKYFVLGNHDLRTHDVARLRAALTEAGFVDLGGKSLLLEGMPVLLAGDERPWFPGAVSLPENPVASDLFRVLLAHTPDRFTWARSENFDLVLAGHTHGGQLRFPLIGPVVCPSWHGTKYACGYFYKEPTLMHVSRGTGSLFPLRLDCPPEITRLVLKKA
jgi:predicted MPP superfamily phosphohydrolase